MRAYLLYTTKVCITVEKLSGDIGQEMDFKGLSRCRHQIVESQNHAQKFKEDNCSETSTENVPF